MSSNLTPSANYTSNGEVQEWLNWLVSKTSVSLPGLRSDLIRTAKQAEHPSLFDRYEPLNKDSMRTPTQADRFLLDAFSELSVYDAQLQHDKAPAPLSPEATLIHRIMNEISPADSLIMLANSFYAGDMAKTFKNLSAVSKMSGLKLPEGWQAFHGTTTEFRHGIKWLTEHPTATRDDFLAWCRSRGSRSVAENLQKNYSTFVKCLPTMSSKVLSA